MICISKIVHRQSIRIKLTFEYDSAIITKVKTIPSSRYSKTLRAWHIDYDKKEYNFLLSLGYIITILPQTGTTTKSENASIASTPSGEDSPSVSFSSPQDIKADIPIKTGKKIVLNNQMFRFQLGYNKDDVAFIKKMERAYWNNNYLTWVIKASVKNLQLLQDRFRLWDSQQYEKILKTISLTENPMKVELYTTPEHRGKIAVKLSGYKVDIEFMKHIPERSYCKVFKRWILPNERIIIERITDHYTAKGAKIINRLPKSAKYYQKAERSLGQKQRYLLRKFGSKFQPLLKEYTDVLIAERYSWQTIISYAGAFYNFSNYIGLEKVAIANEREVTRYIASIAAKKVSDSTINQIVSAIKLYYQKVIFRPNFELQKLRRPRKGRYLPTILSIQEVERILKSLTNLKHITLLYTLYSSGMRLGEVLSVRMNDIHWDRNQIFIKAGKGKKDRMVMLSKMLKEVLIKYVDQYQPEYWLFEGQNGHTQYSPKSVQNVVKNATKKAGINKRVTPHVLRHCFATHLMDNNTGIRYIQELLGHKDIKTTLIYTHVTTASTASIQSPLDSLRLE